MNLAQDIPLNKMLCVIGSLSCVFDAKANALVTVIVVVSVSCSFRFSCSLRRFYRRIRSWYKDERGCGQAALGWKAFDQELASSLPGCCQSF